MSSNNFPFPVAISQLSGDTDSRDHQILRAVKWLLEQPGGPIVVVTPQKRLDGGALKHLIARPGTTHLTWRGLSTGSFTDRRVIHAWPDRKRLNELWGAKADALVVIEWNTADAVEWIEDAKPVRLLRDGFASPDSVLEEIVIDALPKDVSRILEHVAALAAGYDSGLKWNEEDKLKADMMNCPRRWEQVSVDQVRAKCRALAMRPNDVDTITGYLQRRKDGHRFNVRSSYKDFSFPPADRP